MSLAKTQLCRASVRYSHAVPGVLLEAQWITMRCAVQFRSLKQTG